MSDSVAPSLPERALAMLRRKGNPFRQQFARNSDDAVCSLYHVNDLFAREQRLLIDMVESFRARPDQPTCVLPLLGARGAGKTHLLHWLKHGPEGRARLLVTPGTFRIDAGRNDSSFLEYLLYQFINVLLAGGEQRGARPLPLVAEQLTRMVLRGAIGDWSEAEKLALFGGGRLRKVGHYFGVGVGDSLFHIDALANDIEEGKESCRSLAEHHGVNLAALADAASRHVDQTQSRDLKGDLRRQLLRGFLRASLLGQDAELADFLTDGFTDLGHAVAPTREQLTLSLLSALTELIVGTGIPVAVAFDQLEELLYGQTADEIRRSSDAFFGGIVQLMSQVSGLCVLLFVEEGLWNRIVPPLPPHILDRIHEPVHLPRHGTVRQVRLSTPTSEQLADVVACRVRRTLAGLPDVEQLPASFPFGDTFLVDLAKRETVLRLMLQGCCNRLDEIFASGDMPRATRADETVVAPRPTVTLEEPGIEPAAEANPPLETLPREGLVEQWFHEVRAAERKLKPVGSLAGATVELQGALARWLRLCKELGVEKGDWKMASIRDQVSVGNHPTYGALIVVAWTHRSGKSARVGIGMWLGRGVGKPRDLETKLQAFENGAMAVDHLILLRPSDDVRLSGRTKELFDAAISTGRPVSVEPLELETFAKVYAFPRWMQAVGDSFPGAAVPAELYQFLAEQTEGILEKLAIPEKPRSAHAA